MNLLYSNDARGTYPDSWYAATVEELPKQEPLRGRINADLCVIGAGFTGLSTALHAAQAGMEVVLLDAQRVGFGASGRNGGQVGSGFNKDQQALENALGKSDARALWDMAEASKSLTRDLIGRYAPDAAIKPGIAHAAWHVSDATHEHETAAYLASEYGYDQIESLDEEAMQKIIGCPHYKGGTLDHGAFHIHPLRYALDLAKACLAAGVRIFETSPVHRIDGTTVRTEAGHVEADHVIVATNGYGTSLTRHTSRRIMPINNFIAATEPLGVRCSSILNHDIAVADSKFVVNYFRLSEDGRLLFGGGESYGYKFPNDIAAKVRKPMEQVFPQLKDVKIDYAWGGTLAITTSRLPYVARVAPNVIAAGGYSGHGVALAGLTGKIMAQAVRGENDGLDLLSRLPTLNFPGGGALRSPLLALAMTWYSMRDRLGF